MEIVHKNIRYTQLRSNEVNVYVKIEVIVPEFLDIEIEPKYDNVPRGTWTTLKNYVEDLSGDNLDQKQIYTLDEVIPLVNDAWLKGGIQAINRTEQGYTSWLKSNNLTR